MSAMCPLNQDQKLIYQIALSKIVGIGAKTGKQLIAYCGGIEAVFTESKRRLLRIPGIGNHLASQIAQSDPFELAEEDLSYYRKKGIQLIFYLDDDYPTRLTHFEDAPLLLYHKGSFNPHHHRTVSIVGTRRPDPYGRELCQTLVDDLKDYNVQVISGLAYGIDAIAHKTCCDNSTENLAIMGTGMDVIYPAAHKGLAKRIQQNGAIISEFPIQLRPDKENFPRRNRVIAAMSDAVIVIQSKDKGGSLITAEYANSYNKDVFAFPGRTTDHYSKGCNELIKKNKAHLIQSASDIAYVMNWEQSPNQEPKQPRLFLDLDENERKVIDLLSSIETAGIDWLHFSLQMSLGDLSSLLLHMEFKGLIRCLPGKQYAVV